MCYLFSSLCLSISFTFLVCLRVFFILLWWQFFHILQMSVTNYCCQCSELKLNISPTADFF